MRREDIYKAIIRVCDQFGADERCLHWYTDDGGYGECNAIACPIVADLYANEAKRRKERADADRKFLRNAVRVQREINRLLDGGENSVPQEQAIANLKARGEWEE